MEHKNSFGDLLRQHRMAAHLTQEALATRAGLSLRGLSDLERGARRVPYRDTVLRLADALGLDEAKRADLLVAARSRRAGAHMGAESGTRVGLPLSVNSFVGRERGLADIRRLLASTRLLTLTGSGGIGKTRLALHVCAGLDTSDAVTLVELAPVTEPRLVLQAVAAALRVPEEAGSRLLDTLVAAIRKQPCLLVLDNCEHVLSTVADFTDSVLRRTPDARVLATSREPLRVDGETVWRVPPLSLRAASPGDRSQPHGWSDAVRLFIDRARTTQFDFELNEQNASSVELICQRLDGIPLAIELAAAWVGTLSPAEILSRLEASPRFLMGGSRTAPPRHQTMDAAIRWSYDLLSEAERHLFTRLSVFVGGFSLDAAERVCGGKPDTDGADATVWLLRQLVAKSLVVVDSEGGERTRYRLLEPLRAFGAERLHESNEGQAIRDRHAAFYLELVRQSGQVISGGPAVAWNEQLLREYDNLSSVLRWSLDGGDVESAQLAGAALAQIWRRRGHFGEGRALLAELMALPTGSEPTAVRAALLIAAGQAAQSQADFEVADSLFTECVPVARQVGDSLAMALAYGHLSDIARAAGDLKTARLRADQGLAEIRGTGGGVPEALLTLRVAQAHYVADDLEHACRVVDLALPALRGGGWSRRVAEGLHILAAGAARTGDWAAARQFLKEALDLSDQVADLWGLAKVRVEQARLEAGASDVEAAYTHLSDSLALCREIGDRWGIALALEVGAALAASTHDDERAGELAGAAAALRKAIRAPALPREQQWLEQRLDGARAGLGEARFTRACLVGRGLSLEAAIELALKGQR
jgi:predicted ATPase/DNA-binding XRE family transcriptional regulator